MFLKMRLWFLLFLLAILQLECALADPDPDKVIFILPLVNVVEKTNGSPKMTDLQVELPFNQDVSVQLSGGLESVPDWTKRVSFRVERDFSNNKYVVVVCFLGASFPVSLKIRRKDHSNKSVLKYLSDDTSS